MGSLYAMADAAIVRGGTTTLAECKLFNIPLAIVPLPITHDQAKNAQYYVDNYSDILIDQNADDFVDSLKNYILSVSSKTKNYNYNNILKKIQYAKKEILSSML